MPFTHNRQHLLYSICLVCCSYFMIGLPGETDEDVLGIAETIGWLQQEVRQGKWHLAVNVTIRCAALLHF